MDFLCLPDDRELDPPPLHHHQQQQQQQQQQRRPQAGDWLLTDILPELCSPVTASTPPSFASAILPNIPTVTPSPLHASTSLNSFDELNRAFLRAASASSVGANVEAAPVSAAADNDSLLPTATSPSEWSHQAKDAVVAQELEHAADETPMKDPFPDRYLPNSYKHFTDYQRSLIEARGFTFPDRDLTAGEEDRLKRIRRRIKCRVSARNKDAEWRQRCHAMAAQHDQRIQRHQRLFKRRNSMLSETAKLAFTLAATADKVKQYASLLRLRQLMASEAPGQALTYLPASIDVVAGEMQRRAETANRLVGDLIAYRHQTRRSDASSDTLAWQAGDDSVDEQLPALPSLPSPSDVT